MGAFTARPRFLAAVAAVVVVSACGSSSASPPPAAVAPPSGSAVTVRAANGLVRLTHRPARIVSLSPTATEDLFAIGAGAQVVAVDSYSGYPANAPRTSLSGYQPNAEAIAGYRPDLVVVYVDTGQIAEQLARLNIPVLLDPPAPDLAGAYAQITQLGAATGHQAGAARVIAAVRGQIAAIVGSVPRPARPLRVYHELDQTYYSASSDTFIGQIYTLLGLQNIADKAARAGGYPQLSAEYILTANPDLIVLADTVCCGQTRATVAARPGWSHIAAVRTGMIVPVNDAIASEWGPRIALFVTAIADAVKKLEARP
jgi:iron complex transport system substrate-binding protein